MELGYRRSLVLWSSEAWPYYFLAVTEIRAPEPIESISKVNQATSCGEIKDTQRSGYFKAFLHRDGRSAAIIDEDKLSFQGESEGKRRSLAEVQRVEHWIRRRLSLATRLANRVAV